MTEDESPTLLHAQQEPASDPFWERVRAIFQEVAPLPAPQRVDRIISLCHGDDKLLNEVRSLLDSHDEADGFIEPARATPGFAQGDLIAGRYRVIRPLGEGGMGAVVEAEDRELQEHVALKMIRPHIAGDARTLLRFKREIQLARRVTHPNVCRIYDVSTHPGPSDSRSNERSEPGTTFVSMELLPGVTLAERLRTGGPMSSAEALPIIRQLAAGLAAAHDVSIIHRDFKSANVMLVPASDPSQPPRAVITDFGLAQQTDRTGTERLTDTGALLGTPEYMAPEQLEDGPIGPATDIYAFGIVLFEMFTGRLPFNGTTPIAVALSRLQQAAPSPRLLNPTLDRTIEAVILQCLARDPAQRFQRAIDVAETLDGAQPVRRRALGSVRRKRSAWWLLVPAGVLAGALVLRERESAPVTSPLPSSTATSPAPAPVQARRSVAVLGFHDLANRADTRWLADALTEMIGNELAAGGSLRLVSSDVIAPVRADLGWSGSQTLPAEMMQRLRMRTGSDVVVSGSYLAVDPGREGRIRIDIRLQDAASGEVLGSFSESGAQAQLIDLVARIGARLRSELGTTPLSPAQNDSARASQPRDSEAARSYYEGLARLRNFDAIGARPLLERTVAREPGYALGHSSLAEALWTLGYESEARKESETALSLAGPLSREERLLIEARSAVMHKDWDKAIEIYSSIFTFYPDEPAYGIRLAATQLLAARGKDARATIARLRQLPSPLRDDPGIDLVDADVARNLHEPDRELQVSRDAQKKGLALSARSVVARAKTNESYALRDLGKLDESVRLIDEAIGMYDAIGDRGASARALSNMATALWQRGDLKAARVDFERALAVHRSLGNRTFEARTLNNLGNVVFGMGDTAGAESLMKQALHIERETNFLTMIPSTLSNLGAMREVQGDLDGAFVLFKESSALATKNGDRGTQLLVESNTAEVLRLLGRVDEGTQTAQAALELAEELKGPQQRSFLLVQLGELAVLQDNLPAARKYHQDSLALRRETAEKISIAQSLVLLAGVAIEEGKPQEAIAACEEAIQATKEQQAVEDESSAHEALARAWLATGKIDSAASEIAAAASLAKGSTTTLLLTAIRTTEARVLLARGSAGAAAVRARESEAIARKGQLMASRLDAALVEAAAESARGDGAKAKAIRGEVGREAAKNGLQLFVRKVR